MKGKLLYLGLAFALMAAYESSLVLSAQSLNTSTDLFLDDRSSPSQVLQSYYNAINRKEYVRAYYYWGSEGTNATSQSPSYSKFQSEYANTAATQLRIGKVKGQPGAGNIYYQFPVTVVATETDNSKHTYVGCYTIRQTNPKLFVVPPFKPINITSVKIKEVPNGSNTVKLMNQTCL